MTCEGDFVLYLEKSILGDYEKVSVNWLVILLMFTAVNDYDEKFCWINISVAIEAVSSLMQMK